MSVLARNGASERRSAERRAGRVARTDAGGLHSRAAGSKAWSVLFSSLAAIAAALLLSILLSSSPVMAVVVSPLAFGLMDWGVSTALNLPGPRFGLRIFGRVVAAAAAGICLRVLLSMAGTPRAPVLAPWLLPALAIVFCLAWSFAAIASNLVGATSPTVEERRDVDRERPRAPLGEGALVMLADVVAASLAVAISVLSHGAYERDRRVLVVACVAIALIMCVRGLVVASIVHRISVRPSSSMRAIAAFVLWLASSAIGTTMAKDSIAWSGLSAAVLLTFAAILTERRRRSPSAQAALGRATIAWSISTMLSLLLVIGKA